jgi:hypothetical protein
MEQIMSDVIAQTPAALNRLRNLVPTEFPMRIADAIISGIETCVEQLKRELSGKAS